MALHYALVPPARLMSLRFAYSSLTWQPADLERNLGHLAEYGWAGWETREPLDWLGTPQRIRRLCENAGIEVAVVSGPNAGNSLAEPCQQISKRRIEFASELGTQLYMTKGPRHGPDPMASDEELDRIAAVYEDLAEHGSRLGVTVAFHPHVNHFVNSAEEWRRLISRLAICRLCMDMSHAVHWGYDPQQATRDFGDRIAYVHLHDKVNGEAGDLGEGPMCDYAGFLQTVEEVGFTGWVVICPGGHRKEPDSMAANRRFLQSIGY
ncbi:MAG: sugar phosphate isomerase/epimerase family protein [Candidatus Latescibacterota bacterium]|nr:sugar phosphate isomerase/epimerase family protein [Candidatus Latescibacterota bacterium]